MLTESSKPTKTPRRLKPTTKPLSSHSLASGITYVDEALFGRKQLPFTRKTSLYKPPSNEQGSVDQKREGDEPIGGMIDHHHHHDGHHGDQYPQSSVVMVVGEIPEVDASSHSSKNCSSTTFVKEKNKQKEVRKHELEKELASLAVERAAERQALIERADTMLIAQRDEMKQLILILKRLECAATIEKQCDEKQEMKLVEAEDREVEAEEIRACGRELQALVESEDNARRAAVQMMKAAILKRNEELKERKRSQKLAEAEADAAILRWQQEQDAKNKAAEEKRIQEHRQSEKHYASIQAAQQRLADERFAKDEALAARQQDEWELAHKKKEMKEKASKGAQMTDIIATRQAQIHAKLLKKLEEQNEVIKQTEAAIKSLEQAKQQNRLQAMARVMEKDKLREQLKKQIQTRLEEKLGVKIMKAKERSDMVSSLESERQLLEKYGEELIKAASVLPPHLLRLARLKRAELAANPSATMVIRPPQCS
jgi:hypothetical protein